MKAVFSRTRVVFRKEMRDGLRDRRSVLSVFLAPLLWPVMIFLAFQATVERTRSAENIRIPVIGREHAPELIEWLEQRHGVEIEEGPQDFLSAVRDRRSDLVLAIPEDFSRRFSEGRSAEVKLVFDGSRLEASPAVQRVRGLLGAYGQEIATLRLIVRGVSPEVAVPLAVEDVEVAGPQKRAATILLNFLPMIVILAAFIGGMQIATDTTAGERERGSLEPLLTNPVPRTALVAGKWLAAAAFSMACIALTLTLCVVALRRVPLEDLGLRFQFGVPEAVGVLAAVLPMALLASGSQLLVATYARSFKEAQTYLQLLIFLPVVPGVFGSLNPFSSEPWMIPIPLLGQHVLVTDVVAGDMPGLGSFVIGALSALLAGALCVAYTVRLFRREKIIFGR